MQVSVEITGGLQRKLTVQVPSDEIEQEVSSRLNSLKSRVNLKGFRKGKVPFDVVKQHYDGSVRQEVLENTMRQTWQEAVVQEKLRPAGNPQFSPQQAESGKEFEYSVTFEVYPDIEFGSLEGVEIEKPVSEVLDLDIEKVVEKIRVQRVTWNEVDRAAKEEDQVVLNFVGKIDGEAFEGGAAENHPLVLGSKTMIPGFEEQLTGVKVGESRNVEVSFPDDYAKAELAGKPAIFEITVQSVNEPALPEINEEFVKSFGVASGDIAELRSDICKNMQSELDQKLRETAKNNILDVLIEKNELELPQTLIEKEIVALRSQYSQNMPDIKESDLPAELLETEARKRVKLGLLMSEIVQQEKIEVNEDRLSRVLERLAESYEDSAAMIQQYRNDENAMRSIEALALEEAVVEYLLEKVTVTEKMMTFDEVMNP
ncbi:Cell division trigger factor [hydrothermal vent metagenome]|uniref:peptidylprolyl isomerase n=1 Tax=hydrothermal vent metagenome TaxID=652676 RepID=A0A3B0YBX9_9ZZZZ